LPPSSERRGLGATGLEIGPIGFGGWAAGGSEWGHGWSGQSDAESAAALERALEAGIDWIDTAAVYGFGRSETVIGRVLAGRRERPLLFTKCGPVREENGGIRFTLDPASLRRDLEGSLVRLGVPFVDLLQIHRPEPPDGIDEAWEALVALRDEGLARHIGVSNFDVAQIERLERIAPVETVQPQYSLLHRGAEDALLPWARRARAGVIVYSPMASGLLAGSMTRERLASLPPSDWRTTDARFSAPVMERAFELLPRLRAVAERHGVQPGAVAVAWTLRNPAVTGAIVGFRRPEHLEPVLPATTLELTPGDVAELERVSRG